MDKIDDDKVDKIEVLEGPETQGKMTISKTDFSKLGARPKSLAIVEDNDSEKSNKSNLIDVPPTTDSPIRRKIQIGRVATLRGQFDRLAEKEDKDIDLKRLRKTCPKPLTPCSSKRSKKSGRSSFKVTLDKNQRSIREYYRGDAGAE